MHAMNAERPSCSRASHGDGPMYAASGSAAPRPSFSGPAPPTEPVLLKRGYIATVPRAWTATRGVASCLSAASQLAIVSDCLFWSSPPATMTRKSATGCPACTRPFFDSGTRELSVRFGGAAGAVQWTAGVLSHGAVLSSSRARIRWDQPVPVSRETSPSSGI